MLYGWPFASILAVGRRAINTLSISVAHNYGRRVLCYTAVLWVPHHPAHTVRAWVAFSEALRLFITIGHHAAGGDRRAVTKSERDVQVTHPFICEGRGPTSKYTL